MFTYINFLSSFDLLQWILVSYLSLISRYTTETMYANTSSKETNDVLKTKGYIFTPISDVDVE